MKTTDFIPKMRNSRRTCRSWIAVLCALSYCTSAHTQGDGALHQSGKAIAKTHQLKPADYTQNSSRSSMNSVVAPLQFDNSGFGIMFDVLAESNIMLEMVDVNLGSASQHHVEIYFKSGTHQGSEQSPEAWSLVGAISDIASSGVNALTPIPIDIDVTIAAGHRAALYIAVTSSIPNPIGDSTHLLYTNGSSLSNVLTSDPNIMVMEGTGFGIPSTMPFQGGLFSPRKFNGALYYSLCTSNESDVPVVTCAATSLVMGCELSMDPVYTGFPAVTDNFDPHPYVHWEDEVIEINSCPFVQEITRTFYATDLCGNVGSCSQVISVVDVTPPSIDCPPDITVDIALPTGPAVTGMIYTADACSFQPFISWNDVAMTPGECPEVELIKRVWLTSDDCSNTNWCEQFISRIDTSVPPELTCVLSTILECGEEGNLAAAVQPEVSDDCGVPILTYEDVTEDNLDCPFVSTIHRTWTATDIHGNVATCTQIIEILDNTPPVAINCVSDTSLTCADRHSNGFEEYAHGDVIDAFSIGGVAVEVLAYSKGSVAQDAVIFDSGVLGATDTDLGTPNTRFGGPGISGDSEDGFEYSNNRSLGGVLIVQNPNASSEPDDYFLSDSLVFGFEVPVFIESAVVVDIESDMADAGAGLQLFDIEGDLIDFIPFTGGADNNVETVCIMRPSVAKMVMYFSHIIATSGGLAELSILPISEEFEGNVYEDACSEVASEEFSTTYTINDCEVAVSHLISLTDICGNVNTTACQQNISLDVDYDAPTIVPPADLTLPCGIPLPAPDIGTVYVEDNVAAPSEISVMFVEDIVDGTGCDALVKRIYMAVDPCGNVALGAQHIQRVPKLFVEARVLLESAMDADNTTMTTTLNEILPLQQPYSGLYTGYDGTENVEMMPGNAVDWVLLQLIDPVTSEVKATRAALLSTSGLVRDINGAPSVAFDAMHSEYRLVVRHRNHLDIMTLDPVDFTSGTGAVDFANGTQPIDAMHALPSGLFAMISGDSNGDQAIKYNGSSNDKNAILQAVGLLTPNEVLMAYSTLDINMDGLIKYNGASNDKNSILTRVGLLTPNAVITGQLADE